MHRILIDLTHFNDINLAEFDDIFLIGYAKDDIEKIMSLKEQYPQINTILPSENFDNAYILINKFIFNKTQKKPFLLSLLKLCKEELFNLGMVLSAFEVIKGTSTKVEVMLKINPYIKEFDLLREDMYLSSKSVSHLLSKKIKVLSFIKLIFVYLKSLLLLFKGFISYKIQRDFLLVDYADARILGEIQSSLQESQLIEFTHWGKSISTKHFIQFFKYQFILMGYVRRYTLLSNKMYIQANYLLQAYSLVHTYEPKVVLGALDASNYADLYAYVFKENNIKYGCYSHGFNYFFRTEYIYIPFDFYFVWSTEHLNQICEGNYIKSKCKFFVTGVPNYGKKFFDKVDWNRKELYDILVIGEYYYNDYSKQPFNNVATKRLANVLNKVSSKYKICIRPRFVWDGYYDDMKSILEDRVIYNIPTEVSAATTVMEDILSSKIVLSVFSGGTHDTLLVKKPVVQVNFIGMKDPKNLVKEGLIYGAYNETELEDILEKFFSKELIKLDYEKHNKKYINNGVFDIEKVEETLYEYAKKV